MQRRAGEGALSGVERVVSGEVPSCLRLPLVPQGVHVPAPEDSYTASSAPPHRRFRSRPSWTPIYPPPPAPSQEVQIQALMDHIYHDFLGKVAVGRRKSPEEVRALAKGRVYSGEQAVKVRARRDLAILCAPPVSRI